ncbi:MAG TPA: hypothetical protein VHQ65_14845 [Thermoanaerobaculia bacterium]|nr:hypothetical protein [Thermoanaerobaculia bacterium]
MTSPGNHLPHLLLLLHAIEQTRESPRPAQGFEMPREVFLAREEATCFWELVALRVVGHPALIFGAVRFRRQSADSPHLPRQSLVSYLSQPVKEVSLEETPYPPDLLEMMVPEAEETILSFLERLRSRQPGRKVLVDRRQIELAFDFRLDNPSLSRHRPTGNGNGNGNGNGASPQRFLFRTTSGHVLSAYPYRLPSTLHRPDEFLALTRPTQHSATIDRALPTLVVRRSFLTVTAPAEEGLVRWLERSVPFQIGLANPRHLLDPLLESYRAYRRRLLREEPEPQVVGLGAA